MSIVSKAVGEKIRIYRKKKHMTLAELAECICKSKATVSKYETGAAAPPSRLRVQHRLRSL